ncbi:MAG: hypothetical protein IJO06_02170 [Thermoguttaceae bacterium]|nr:hypothetical protein [Thermoguttaceae bacterium]MBQ7110001.1 hypothetical protein [Thermoguttaceae bacterium]
MLDRKTYEALSKALKNRERSCRSIAREFGVSHTLALKIRRYRGRVRVADAPEIDAPDGDFQRCPRCGGKTRLPCVYCAVRDSLAETPPAENPADQDDERGPAFLGDEFALDLTPEEFERYQEVRAWRERRPNPRFDVIPDDWPWRDETFVDETSPRATEAALVEPPRVKRRSTPVFIQP